MCGVINRLSNIANRDELRNVHAHHQAAEVIVLLNGNIAQLQHGTQHRPGSVRLTGSRIHSATQLREGA